MRATPTGSHDLRWVVLTHDDNDHAGNAHRILELAPKARLVVNWLAAARMQDSLCLIFLIGPVRYSGAAHLR